MYLLTLGDGGRLQRRDVGGGGGGACEVGQYDYLSLVSIVLVRSGLRIFSSFLSRLMRRFVSFRTSMPLLCMVFASAAAIARCTESSSAVGPSTG